MHQLLGCVIHVITALILSAYTCMHCALCITNNRQLGEEGDAYSGRRERAVYGLKEVQHACMRTLHLCTCTCVLMYIYYAAVPISVQLY
jgi:hypothetical protein